MPLVPKMAHCAQVELIDLHTVLSWDIEMVTKGIRRTGRLMIVHEASCTAGVGAKVAAEIQRKAFLTVSCIPPCSTGRG